MPDEQSNEHRAADHAEGKPLGSEAECDRAEDHPGDDAEAEGDEVRLVEGFRAVARILCEPGEVPRSADDEQRVAPLYDVFEVGHELDFVARDARNRHAEGTEQAKCPDGLPDYVFRSNHHLHPFVFGVEVVVGARTLSAEERNDGIESEGPSHEQEMLPGFDEEVLVDRHQAVVVEDAGDLAVGLRNHLEIGQSPARERRVLHLDEDPMDGAVGAGRRMQLPVHLVEVDPEQAGEQLHKQHHADDAERIGDAVADGSLAPGGQGFHNGREAGRARQCPGEQAGGQVGGQVQRAGQHPGGRRTGGDQNDGQNGQRLTLLPENAEKAGTGGEADAIDE